MIHICHIYQYIIISIKICYLSPAIDTMNYTSQEKEIVFDYPYNEVDNSKMVSIYINKNTI